jgi:hypothetical protein
MRFRSPALIPLAAAVLAAAALAGGCGSDSERTAQTVDTSQPPATATGADTTTTTATTTAPAKTTDTTSTATAPPTTTGTTPTRTQTAPASAPSASSPGLAGATATVTRQGYAVTATSTYRTASTLRVLVGARQGSSDGRAQKAFFFVGDRYLGTDASDASGQIEVVGQDDSSVTLRYALYRRSDGACCPTGGHADVRFQLDQGRLSPLDDIPPASQAAALSRR